MIWHAVNRNDFRPASEICRFAEFEVAHIDFEFHKRVLMRCPQVRTKALIYTYPAALFESMRQPSGAIVAGNARPYIYYGNPFEYVGAFHEYLLPWLRDRAGQPIVDFPGTGHRYWVDYNRIDIDLQIGQLRQRLEQFAKVDTLDDGELLALLNKFGQSDPRYDVNRDGVVSDADLLAVLFEYGNRVSTEPLMYLEKWIEGFFIDNYPEYLGYTQLSGLSTAQQISGYQRFCSVLRAVIPSAMLHINCYEGNMFRKVGGTDDSPVLAEPSESILEFIDAVFFENWRWHWASRGGMLAPSTIRAIEQRVDWLIAKGKTVVLAVNHAYDDAGVQQRLEAIEYAVRRWGSQVRFSEHRPLYAGSRSVVEQAQTKFTSPNA